MVDTKTELTVDEGLAAEAKAITVLAFRNGPLEDVHAGQACPTCAGKAEYSHITQDEMKSIMKNAVNKVYAFLWIRTQCPDVYPEIVNAGLRFAPSWDPPENCKQEIEFLARMADLLSGSQKIADRTSSVTRTPKRRRIPPKKTQ